MQPYLAFCLTFAVGTGGFFLFRLCRIPNPAMLGSMVATGALNIFGLYPEFSTWFVSFAANVLIGIMIGRQIDRAVFRRVVELGKPMFFQMLGIFTLSLACGYALYLMGGGEVSLKTALISGAAGGITEMIIFGMAVQADIAVIAFVQLFRVVIFLSLIPYIAIVCEKFGRSTRKDARKQSVRANLAFFNKRDYALLAVSALAGALVGRWLRIPSGVLIGAMLACGALSLALNKRYRFNVRLRYIAQICLGLVLGQRMTPEMVTQLGQLFFPAMVVTCVMLVGCTLLAFLLRANTGWDLITCLMCSAPAGLSQATIYADEIGADSFLASVFHTVRIIGIVSVYPWIIAPLI